MKKTVKQLHAALANKYSIPIGSPDEAPSSLNPWEKGKTTFTTIKTIV
jgi:hypothetical protein